MTKNFKHIRSAIDDALQEKEAFIHLITTTDELNIPEFLTKDPTVTLKISYHFAGPVTLQSDHLTAELNFASGRHTCHVPYSAIWGLTDINGKKTLWHENIPAEILFSLPSQVAKEKQEGVQGENVNKKSKSPAKLKRIK